MKRSGLLSITAGLVLLVQPASAQETPAPAPAPPPLAAGAVSPGVEGVLDAFKTHPLVGLGDAHGMAQEMDFYAAVVRHPRFAAEVGNLVVEFGGAAHQAVIDRYLAGEPVPYVELRKVWTDTVGWLPMPAGIGFMNVFAQVRATNTTLPPEKRIRVWLGEPPIDWSKIQSRDDLQPLLQQRDSHAAEVIRREILGQGRKALVIYGGAHFSRGYGAFTPAKAARPGTEAALRSLLTGAAKGEPPYGMMVPAFEQVARAQAERTKTTLTGFGPMKAMRFRGSDGGRMDVFDVTYAKQEVRARIMLNGEGKIEGAFFGPLDMMRPMLVDVVEKQQPGAFFIAQPYTGYADAACSQRFEAAVGAAPALVRAKPLLEALGASGCTDPGLAAGDAVLFVGPRAALTYSPTTPDLYLDDDYRREIARRYQIMTGQPMPPVTEVQPVTPYKFRP